MKLRTLFFRSISTIILACAVTQSRAGPTDLVELTGYIGFSSVTGSGGFEIDTPNGDNVEWGPFRLIYDPGIPDTDNSELRGLFPGAIKSFVMIIGQEYRPALRFALVGRGDISREFSATTSMDSVQWLMTLREENGVIDPSLFFFRMFRYGWGNVNVTMPPIDYWRTATANEAGTGSIGELDWLWGPISARTVPRPVPAPPTVWLLLIGAAAILSARVFPGNAKPCQPVCG